MRRIGTILLTMAALVAPAAAQGPALAPTGTLRAVYIASNPAQAVRNVTTGEVKGVSADVARELGRRLGVPVTITPAPSAFAVIDAVKSGQADIGFVAPNPDRMGVVAFSQTYMLVQQSFLVRADSDIRSVADLDRPGRAIGASKDDSVAVYLRTWLKQASLRESPDFTLKEATDWLAKGTVHAFGANRQRLGAAMRGAQGLRLLPDNLYGVPQTIALPIDKPELLAQVNKAIDEMRASGFLKDAIEKSGIDGLSVAAAQ